MLSGQCECSNGFSSSQAARKDFIIEPPPGAGRFDRSARVKLRRLRKFTFLMSPLLLLLGALLLLLLATRTSEALEQLRIARVHQFSCLSIQRVRASVSIGSSRGGGDDRDRVQRRRYVYHGCTGPLMAKRRTTLGEQQWCNAHAHMHDVPSLNVSVMLTSIR